MKSITLALAILAATTADAAFDVTSRPFRLTLQSSNATLDGTTLGACHEMIMTNALCFSHQLFSDAVQPDSTFNHKVEAPAQPNAVNIHGALTYTLSGGNFENDLIMALLPAGYNWNEPEIPVAIFSARPQADYVNFDDQQKMHRWENGVKLYNWYMCDTKWNNFFTTLVWKVGQGAPTYPTCQKVDVVRVFV